MAADRARPRCRVLCLGASMRRREFITLVGGAALAPITALAQPRTIPVVGFLGQSTPAAESQRTKAFVERLGELGWSEGRTVTIKYGWGEGRSEKFADIAAE